MAETENAASVKFRGVAHDGYQGSLKRGYQPATNTPIPKAPQVGTTTVKPSAPASSTTQGSTDNK